MEKIQYYSNLEIKKKILREIEIESLEVSYNAKIGNIEYDQSSKKCQDDF